MLCFCLNAARHVARWRHQHAAEQHQQGQGQSHLLLAGAMLVGVNHRAAKIVIFRLGVNSMINFVLRNKMSIFVEVI